MTTTFAALLYRPADIPDRALSLGFAVALGGWDVPSPELHIAEVAGLPDHAVAFYVSGAPREDVAEHLSDLFEDELSPPVPVLDAAEAMGHAGARLHAIVYSDELVLDDAWRFDGSGFERHFVRDGEDGIEAGVETADDSQVETLALDIPEDATDDQERAILDSALRPHRGTTFLSNALGIKVLPALVRSLFEVDRKIPVRFVGRDAASITDETDRLVRVLGRTAGRGAFSPPVLASGVAAPASVEAFVQAYDWHDPSDPGDLYRELAIGGVTGTLRFLREDEIRAVESDVAWRAAISKKNGDFGPKGDPRPGAPRRGSPLGPTALYPVAKLLGSALGGQSAATAVLAVDADGDRLFRLRRDRKPELAGPTFGELLCYLRLGWSKRTEAEEDVIGALMLRARLRHEAATGA